MASHIPSQGDVALPIPGVSGGDKRELSEPGALGDTAGALPLLQPQADRWGLQNPQEGLQPLTKQGLNYLIKSPQLKQCRR